MMSREMEVNHYFIHLCVLNGLPWGVYKGQDGFYMRGTVKLNHQTVNSNLTYLLTEKSKL